MTDDERAWWDDWLVDHKGVMFKMEWYRIILDEAQYFPLKSDILTYSVIKNPTVRSSLACGALKSPRKWCLTGIYISLSL